MKPNHTKDQRKRLFLLARLLDKVPRKHFDIEQWIEDNEGFHPGPIYITPKMIESLAAKKCGYSGCAMGWGMTSRTIRGRARDISNLIDGLGFSWADFSERGNAGCRLFGSQRGEVAPKTVAADIRRYLKDGTLPNA